MGKRRYQAVVLLLLLFMITAVLQQYIGSVWPGSVAKASEIKVEEELSGAGFYDSSDTAIVVQKAEGSITLYNLLKGREYTLKVTGSSRLYDKYGSAISFSQLSVGEIADVQFLKATRELTGLRISAAVWTLDDVNKFEVDHSGSRIKIMDEWYEVGEDTVILSDNEAVELLDVNEQDILKIQGVDHKIYSIVIEQGHGYLRLTNDEYFVEGWIEVGQRIIRQIEPDMMLPVPEGKYEVFLSHGDIEGSKEVVIERGKETTLDVGDIRKEDMVKFGNLIFTIEPASAEVYLDGKLIDISRTIKTEYGLHQIMAKAEGYETVIQYIKVSQGSANISIILEKEKERKDTTVQSVNNNPASVSTNSVSSNSVSSNSVSSNSVKPGSTPSGSTSSSSNRVSTTGYKVNINAPQGAEVYVDGNYVGIAPTSFAKKAGSRVITIRKTGYQSRTYTIQIDEAQKDIDYSFSELIPISDVPAQNGDRGESEKKPSVSQNQTVSGNQQEGGKLPENGGKKGTVSSNTISGNP